MPGKRKKPPAGSNDSTPVYTYQSVKMKLNQLCDLDFLADEICTMASELTLVGLLGWKIAGMHILRCLQEGAALPVLDSNFFYRCCSASLDETEKMTRNKPTYPDLHPTFVRYWELCDRLPEYLPPSSVNSDAMRRAMANTMETNTINMLALHFRRRLHQYIRFRYAKPGKLQLGYKATRKLVAGCYRVKEVPHLDGDGADTGKVVYVWDEPRSPAERELRDWLGFVPWEWRIRQNPAHFIVKLYDMLQWMEEFVEKHPKTKGARLYSLLPYSSSFIPAHVTLNITSLHQVFCRLFTDPERQAEVKAYVNDELGVECGSTEQVRRQFSENKDAVFRRMFRLNGLETSTREFAYQITTDGYAASVLLRRQMPRRENDDNPDQPCKRQKNNKGEVVKAPEAVKEGALEAAMNKLPPGYAPDVMIGIDPGVRTLCTAACEGGLPTRQSRRRRNRQGKRKHKNRRAKHKRKNRHRQRIVAINTREYYHMSKVGKHRFWNNGLREKEASYAKILNGMPTFKTASYQVYLDRLRYFLKHAEYLVLFSTRHSFRKWRFLLYRMKMKAIDSLAKRLVPTPSPQVCIAFGDWSCQDGLRGNPRAPVKAFRKALERRATVLPMDEFRTSKLCSCCHLSLRRARLLIKVKDKDTKEDEIVLKGNRNVLHCKNSRCRAHFWNRDVNAAINILELLKCRLLDLGRLAAFQR